MFPNYHSPSTPPPPPPDTHSLSWEPCSSAPTSGGSYCSQHWDRGTGRFPHHRISTPGAPISMISGNMGVRPACVLLGKFNDLSDHQSPHLWNGENNTCPLQDYHKISNANPYIYWEMLTIEGRIMRKVFCLVKTNTVPDIYKWNVKKKLKHDVAWMGAAASPVRHISIELPSLPTSLPMGGCLLGVMFTAFKLFHVTKDVQRLCLLLWLDLKAFQACFKDERLKGWCALTG